MLVLGITACASSDSVLVGNISQEVMCQCGACTEVLDDCHCPTAGEMTASIEKRLAQGQSKEQIVQYFINRYGEQVLAPRSNT